MERQDVAILYSGGRDSLALYARCLSGMGMEPDTPRPKKVHLLHMLNGMGRFPSFPRDRLEVSREILTRQIPAGENVPETVLVELDCGRLFQGLWLDNYEDLMPRFGGKNLVCVACKLAMHTQAIVYCIKHYVPVLMAGYARRQAFYPEQTHAFMERIEALGIHFGIRTRFPLYDEFDTEETARHFLESLGLPSTGGGERKCLFCQTKTTAREEHIGDYLDHFIPKVKEYVEHLLEGRIRSAAHLFPPGNAER